MIRALALLIITGLFAFVFMPEASQRSLGIGENLKSAKAGD